VVDHAFAVQPVGQPDLGEQVDGAVFEHAGPDPPLDVRPAVVLQHDRVDAGEVQQVGEDESGRSGADDADLGTHQNG